MKYITSAYWEKGNSYPINEDSLLLLQALTVQGRVLLAAVCDGMGGMEQGECASGYLTEELIAWFYDGLIPAVVQKKSIWAIRRSFQRKLYQIWSRMEVYGDKNNIAFGTTMSVLVIWDMRYLIWHLGDCRIYHISAQNRLFPKLNGGKGNIKLLTRDHREDTNRLTKCVGSFVPYIVPDFVTGTVRPKEVFLLCSDGFWNLIKEGELGQALSPEELTGEKQIGRRLEEFGKAAVRRGEKDNMSAVCVVAL